MTITREEAIKKAAKLLFGNEGELSVPAPEGWEDQIFQLPTAKGNELVSFNGLVERLSAGA